MQRLKLTECKHSSILGKIKGQILVLWCKVLVHEMLLELTVGWLITSREETGNGEFSGLWWKCMGEGRCLCWGTWCGSGKTLGWFGTACQKKSCSLPPVKAVNKLPAYKYCCPVLLADHEPQFLCCGPTASGPQSTAITEARCQERWWCCLKA